MGLLDQVNPLDAAIASVASSIGVSPEAVKQVISVESNGDPRATTGSYSGLTQIGPTTFKEAGGTLAGMTYDQYKNAPPEAQVAAYGDYLKHYNFAGQMAKHGIDVSNMSPDQQFAVLQGMQFSPNGQAWKAALAQGNTNVPVTNTKQAGALGSTSIADMMASRFGRAAVGAGPLPAPLEVSSLTPPAQPLGAPQAPPQQPLPPQQPNMASNGQQMAAYGWSPQQEAQPQLPQLNPLASRPDMQKIAMLRAAMSNPRIRLRG